MNTTAVTAYTYTVYSSHLCFLSISF